MNLLDSRWETIERLQEVAARAACGVFQQVDAARQGSAEISLVFTNDIHICSLNEEYRGKPSATNVLSFPALPPDSEACNHQLLLGDVVLSFETITNEAQDQGKDFENHLCHLIIHGVLHLLGYDHEIDADAEKMERIEISALAQLGVANPYETDSCVDLPER